MNRLVALAIGLWVLLPATCSWAQVADSAAAACTDSAANFRVMFLAEPSDTLIFTREAIAQEFIPTDTVEAITEADVYDTLDFRNYIPGTPFELIEDRLSCIQADVPLTFNKTVNSFINFFVVRKRNYTQTMLERKDHFFPIFEAALRRYELPDELKYLSIVESGLNMRAISKSGAVGLWQFMSATGRDFKLYQNKYADERMDPHKATEAACRYLRFLYNQFNDWELALAAYNCGPGSIRRTLARTGGRTFWEIYNALPQETRSYVPQFTAVVYAMHYAEAHNLRPDADSMLVLPAHDTVLVNRQVNLTALSNHLQVDAKTLVLLNPTLRKPVTPEQVPYALTLPAEAAERFRAERACYLEMAQGEPLPEPAPRTKPAPTERIVARKRHTVRRGETLFAIADKFEVSVQDLRRWNHLRTNRVRPGQRLTVAITTKGKAVPAKPDSTIGPTLANVPKAVAEQIRLAQKQQSQPDTLATVADSAAEATAPVLAQAPAPKPKRTAKPRLAPPTPPPPASAEAPAPAAQGKVYEVQPGDTLWNISTRQGLTVEQLMKLNGLKDKNLKVGQKLILG